MPDTLLAQIICKSIIFMLFGSAARIKRYGSAHAIIPHGVRVMTQGYELPAEE
jgi:hypothetical protein